MNKKIARRWVAALRSKKYKQGKSALHPTPDTYCCLGVLCDVARRSRLGKWQVVKGVDESPDFIPAKDRAERHHGYLPRPIREWAGVDHGFQITLSDANDAGKPFSTIAKMIEKEAGLSRGSVEVAE